jgi:hypothetical protein
MRIGRRHVGNLAVIATSIFFLIFISVRFDVATGRVIDKGTLSPEQPILSLVADELDARGIDTVFGKSADYTLSEGAVRVAPLAGFTPHKQDWGSYLNQTWESAFRKGVIGFIIAVPNQTSSISEAGASCIKDILELGRDVCEFVHKWLTAPADRKVFVAFTKDDFEHADQVRISLEKAGFTVFLFLKGKDQKPWADPGMVGEVFAQAKFRLVIDSANARGSPGVALERECCEPLLSPSPPTTPLMLALQGKS